jgi:hypothetical protein
VSDATNEFSELISAVDPHEIDALVSQAKIETYKPRPFEDLNGVALFDRQVNRLIELGYPEVMRTTTRAVMRLLDPLQGEALGPETHDIPFLVAIPPILVSVGDQLSLVRHEGGGVTQFLEDADLVNRSGLETPEGPYLLRGVDVGDELRGLSPESASRRVIDAGRSPLTIAEGAALLSHYPHILDFLNLHLAGTLHKSANAVDVYAYPGAVKLKRDPAHLGDPRWGTPSCAERVDPAVRP